jgi:serine/threonine protein kinase/Tol biopolymer transport system component
MVLVAGAMLGPYEIVKALGAGGMGEVYLARDVRLERVVAIKVLKAGESQEPGLQTRFEREARTISSLNHPNICRLYDVGEQDGLRYLVMEYLDGETLADRIGTGALRLEKVVEYGIEICRGLEKAHRSGVIHRDLKPGNIMLTTAGVKILDFGLAKPLGSDTPPFTQTVSMARGPLSGEGRIMGTLPYISPEQAEGKEADRQSDIFSLGAVLYEMTTGKRPFPGDNPFTVVSAILERDPAPIRALKPGTPAALEHAIERCLAKDRESRWQSAHDVALQLSWIAEGASSARVQNQAVRRSSFWSWVAWATAAVLAFACLALGIGFFQRAPRLFPPLRASLLPPAGSSFLPYNFAIAPNGNRLAFVALGPDGKTALWVRGLSSGSAQQLTGTEGAEYPFWSPDGLHVGFFAQHRLKSVDLGTYAVQNICEAVSGFGGTWNREGSIVFAPGITGPLQRVNAGGGTPEPVTKVPSGSSESHHWPFFLPDGRHFLYVVNWAPASHARNGLYVGSLDKDSPQLVAPSLIGNVLFASGYLLYVRDRTVVAQRFDLSGFRVTGPVIPITESEVDTFSDFAQSGFSVSEEGKLAFQSAADFYSRLVWYDAHGKELGQFPEIDYQGPQFSRDGRYLAVYADDEHNGKHFIRIYDLKRGVSTRLTQGGFETFPVWTHDGKFIVFRNASLNIEDTPADGSGNSQQLVTGTNVVPCDLSADGHLVYMSVDTGTPFPRLDVYSMRDHKSTRFVDFGAEPQISPDGQWIAYIQLPIRQVIVRRFPGPGPRVQISNLNGSTQPRWSSDGRKIFFINPDRKLMEVAFDAAKASAGPPQIFAQTRIAVTYFGWFQYAVAPDGRVLVNSLPPNNSPVTLLIGWEAILKQR